jgi:RNA polymerase sigma-70 factor, ECF subfamily
MAETSRSILLNLLLTGYDDLKLRLTRRLGSSDLAGEALQDTFLRLELAGDIGVVSSPQGYLFRTALNIATDRRRAESRHLNHVEVDALLDLADSSPDAARTIEGRSEVEALKRALAELPPRRRAIFVAAWVEGVPRQVLAARFGVSLRTIKLELKRARDYCALRLDRDVTKRFPPAPRQSSSD